MAKKKSAIKRVSAKKRVSSKKKGSAPPKAKTANHNRVSRLVSVLIGNTTYDSKRLGSLLSREQCEAATSQKRKLKQYLGKGKVRVVAPLIPVTYLNLFHMYALEKLRELAESGIPYTIFLKDFSSTRDDDILTRRALVERRRAVASEQDSKGLVLSSDIFREVKETGKFKQFLVMYQNVVEKNVLTHISELFTVCLYAESLKLDKGVILVGENEKSTYDVFLQSFPELNKKVFLLYLPQLPIGTTPPHLGEGEEEVHNKLELILSNSADLDRLCLAFELLFLDRNVGPKQKVSGVFDKIHDLKESDEYMNSLVKRMVNFFFTEYGLRKSIYDESEFKKTALE